MSDFTPEAIAQQSFRTALRGYDQAQVRDFLDGLAKRVAVLVEERDRLSAKLEVGVPADLEHEIEVVSKEIHSVLESARSAAEAMRERATAETARWRSEAAAEADKLRRQAEADAEHLRTDAWTTSEALLVQVQRHAEFLATEAEKEALRLVGEAERDAHRITGSGRREAEEAVRMARMESEKLVLDAKATHDEIIESASRQAEVAQERTRALEARRDELRRELDGVRAAITAVETELDERREALGLTPSHVATPESESHETWVPGETVRVVRPGQANGGVSEPPPPEPRGVPERTPELRVLSADELRSRRSPLPAMHRPVDDPLDPEPDEPEPDEPAAGVEGPEAETEEAFTAAVEVEEIDAPSQPGEPEPAVPPQPEPQRTPEPPPAARGGSIEDLEGLFARLRQPVSSEEPVVSSVQPSDLPAAAVADDRPHDGHPFELRDELLLPVSNRALRNLKRQLTEEQNAALEAIRLDEKGWLPDLEALQNNLRADLVVLEAESYAAGHQAAESLTGERLTRPSPPASGLDVRFATALVHDLEHAVSDGRAHAHGARQLGADVSRVFRAWRTDEAERRLRHYSYEAYNRGVAESAASAVEPALRWVLAGRGCAVCRDFGGRASVEGLPPAHEGCACTIVPG